MTEERKYACEGCGRAYRNGHGAWVAQASGGELWLCLNCQKAAPTPVAEPPAVASHQDVLQGLVAMQAYVERSLQNAADAGEQRLLDRDYALRRALRGAERVCRDWLAEHADEGVVQPI